MIRAIYAGSFDPPTLGHSWMIWQGMKLFPELIVSVGVNPDKKPHFSLDQRLQWLEQICADIRHQMHDVNCLTTVGHFEGKFLVSHATSIGATHILRGIRNEADFCYEQSMRHINSDLAPEVDSVYLMPPRDLSEISSSVVRGLIGPEGWEKVVTKYVPNCVRQTLVGAKG